MVQFLMSSITMKNVLAAVSSIVPFIPTIIDYFQEDPETLDSEQLRAFCELVIVMEDYSGGMELPEWILVCAHTNSQYRKIIAVEQYQKLYQQHKEK